MMRQRASGSAGYATGQNDYGGYSGGNGYSNNGYSSNGYGGYSQQSYGGYSGGNTMYGGVNNFPSSSGDDKYSKRSSSRSMPSIGSLMGTGSPLMLLCIIMALWSVAVMGLWMNVRGKYNSILTEFNVPNSDALMDLYKRLQTDLSTAQHEMDRSIRDTQVKLNGRQQELERENRLLQKERDELRVKYEGPDKEEEESRLQLREVAFQHQVELLQEATRKESKRNVLERYVFEGI